MRVDVRSLGSQAVVLDREMSDLSRQIFTLAGNEFNIGSPKQLAEMLFEKLQLPVLKRTGTRARRRRPSMCSRSSRSSTTSAASSSTGAQLTKLKGTYLDALPRW